MVARIASAGTALLRLDERNRREWTLAAMCCALFMAMLDGSVVSVALPAIRADFGSSLAGLEWINHAYTIPFAVLLVTAGRLADVLGRRRVMLVGVLAFAASSMAIGLAPGPAWMIAGRFVQGAAAAAMLPASMAIIAHAFPVHERGRAMGVAAGCSAIALAAGPVVAGVLIESASWRAIFFLNLPVAATTVVLTLLTVHESRDATVEPRVDWLGVAALSLGLSAFVLALVEGGVWGWGSPATLALLALAPLALAAFVHVERTVRAPTLEFAYFRSHTFLGANMTGLVVTLAAFGAFFFNALYMQDVLGYSALEAGMRFLPLTVAVLLVAPLAGRLADRVGPRRPIVGGMLLVTGALWLETRVGGVTGYGPLAPALLLLGIGQALVISPMTAAAMNSVHGDKSGAASGILTMSRVVGATLGVAALGALVGTTGPHGTAAARQAFAHGLERGMWLATGLALATAAAAALLIAGPERR
ncbi:MAG TPA: MFS transporter [Conexibacter sp.]|nr:MFS transporter [Conexibacter sp.]